MLHACVLRFDVMENPVNFWGFEYIVSLDFATVVFLFLFNNYYLIID